MTNEEIAENILKKINLAEKILIIASKHIDYDSLGTALTIKWWLNKKGKDNVKIYTFSYLPDNFESFHSLSDVIQNQMAKVDFNYFDLIILPDGNSWRQFFTNDADKYLTDVDKNRIVNIDHHEFGELNKEIPDSSLRQMDCCTSKVFYDYFIKGSGIDLDVEAATWIYMALVGDTGTFNYAIYPDTFAFANIILSYGVDHDKAVNLDIDKRMVDFLVWGVKHTVYYPDIKTTILAITDQLKKEVDEKLGRDWGNEDIDKYYKNVFLRMVKGFPYGIIFESRDKSQRTEVSWRTKNYGGNIEIMEVLREAGFKAGGHRNAGGGMGDFHIQVAVEKFVSIMKKRLTIS